MLSRTFFGCQQSLCRSVCSFFSSVVSSWSDFWSSYAVLQKAHISSLPLCILVLIYFFFIITVWKTFGFSTGRYTDCHEKFVHLCLLGSVTNMHSVEAERFERWRLHWCLVLFFPPQCYRLLVSCATACQPLARKEKSHKLSGNQTGQLSQAPASPVACVVVVLSCAYLCSNCFM